MVDEDKLKELLTDITVSLGKLVEPNLYNRALIESVLDKIKRANLTGE